MRLKCSSYTASFDRDPLPSLPRDDCLSAIDCAVLISYYEPVFGKGVAKEFLELTEKNKKVDGISTCELNQSHEYYIRSNFGLPT